MKTSIITLFLLLYFSTAQAATFIQNFPVISSHLEINNTTSSHTTDVTTLVARAKSRGGDEVGNGGDDIRQKFLARAKQILKSSPKLQTLISTDSFKEIFSTNHVLVLDNLKSENFSLPYALFKGIILLDRQTWNTSDGLLSDKVDPRFEILKIIQLTEKKQNDLDLLLEIFSALPFFTSLESGDQIHAPPFCALNSQETAIKKTPIFFSDTHPDNPELLKSSTLKKCEEAGLHECRVTAFNQSGFLSHTSYKITVQGFQYSTIPMSESEKQANRCFELQRCSSLFELAPMGQIASKDFKQLDEEISRQCSRN